MVFNNCTRVMPFIGPFGRRLLAHPANQQVRTFFGPWPRPSDFRSLVRDMDRQIDRMGREMERMERDIFRAMPPVLPRLMPVSPDHTTSPTDGGQYRVSVDVSGFKPEEINISLDETGRQLTIKAKCERSNSDGTVWAQEMTRTLSLPSSVDMAELKSMLMSNGLLAIEAPLKEESVKQIPINRVEGGSQPEQIEQNSDKVSSST